MGQILVAIYLREFVLYIGLLYSDIFIGLNYRADTVTSFLHVQCTCRLIVNATTQCAYKSPLCSTCMWAFLCSDYKGDGMMKVEKNKKVQE